MSRPMGKRPPIAPASQLEGSGTMSMLAHAALPAGFAFPDPLTHAAESARDCSLHRRVSVADDAVYPAKTAQTSPTTAATEVAAKEAAFDGAGGAQGGRIDEGCRRAQPPPPAGRLRPPPGPGGRREAQERRRSGLPTHTGGPDGRRTAGRAAGDVGDSATAGSLGASEPTFVRAYTCSSVHSSVVYGAS